VLNNEKLDVKVEKLKDENIASLGIGTNSMLKSVFELTSTSL
jgi:hypothetical protein